MLFACYLHQEFSLSRITAAVEPRFNEPLYNEVFSITTDIPGPSNNKIYGKEPRYSEHICQSLGLRFHCISSNYVISNSQLTVKITIKVSSNQESVNPIQTTKSRMKSFHFLLL